MVGKKPFRYFIAVQAQRYARTLSPSLRAGALQDGTGADQILPLMTRELAVDGQGAVDIAFLELTR